MVEGVADPARSGRVVIDTHLDGRNVAAVRASIIDAVDRFPDVIVVDMAACEFIDDSGLAMLTAAHLRAERSGRRLVLVHCSKEIRRLLAITGLTRVLHVERQTSLST